MVRLFLCSLLFLTAPDVFAQVTVRYVANEGVLLVADTTRIMIDGLHRPYRTQYASLGAKDRQLAESAEDLFAGIDLLLASHHHGDHFSGEAIASHLRSSATARFAGASQMTEAVLRAGAPAGLLDSFDVLPGSHFVTTGPGYSVELIGIMHGGRTWDDVENLGHVIELGGVRFLHIGDADTDTEHFTGLELADDPVDVAFIPFWFLESASARQMIATHIRPRRVVAVHVPPGDGERLRKAVGEHYPELVIFNQPLQDVFSVEASDL
jgi:L-ascorbate metabolism protein UlaG (beta-lactamase superfamily)